MRYCFIIMVAIIFSTFCGSCNFSQGSKQKDLELELKKKELDLKERELNLLESRNQTAKNESTKITAKQNSNKKELVYLYSSNGGLIGYFNDGSVVGCPRCDFCKSNILAMFKSKSSGTWNLKKPEDFKSYEDDNGWVLINYKWKEKVPQF